MDRGISAAQVKSSMSLRQEKPSQEHPELFESIKAPRTYFKELVASWQSKEDVATWANNHNIKVEQLGNSSWLAVTSAKAPPEGIGKALQGLYTAITKDSRFQTDGKRDFGKFKQFIGLTSKTEIVASWQTKEDVFAWIESEGIALKLIGNARWLMSTSAKPPPEGIGKSCSGLYSAIVSDSRFQTDGVADFSRFREFIGAEKANIWEVIVASWQSREDVFAWAKGEGLTLEQLGSARWLFRFSAKAAPEGVGKSYSGLYTAITNDLRFQTNEKPDFGRFKKFIGIQSNAEIVASWQAKEDVLAWAESEGITLEQLGKSNWLKTFSAKAPPEGVQRSYYGLYLAIVSDPRFQTNKRADFYKFKEFIGVEKRVTLNEVVANWQTRQDVLVWAKCEGITLEQLGSATWLQLKLNEFPPERVGKSYFPLYRSIVQDPRFQTDEKADFNKFKEFIGFESKHVWQDRVLNWRSKEDVLVWAKAASVTLEQVGNANWLFRKSAKAAPEGVEKSYRNLHFAISSDPRFQTNGTPDFSKFRKFIGVESQTEDSLVMAISAIQPDR